MAVVNMCTTCFKIKKLKLFAQSISYDRYSEKSLFPKPSFCFLLFFKVESSLPVFLIDKFHATILILLLI